MSHEEEHKNLEPETVYDSPSLDKKVRDDAVAEAEPSAQVEAQQDK